MSVSDEPTKLANIVVPALSDEAEGWEASLGNGSNIKLIAGALAQDDCAIFGLQGNQDLVLGSDYVRGPKFSLYELGYLSNFDIGYYLAMANFSDIAAMGAQPIALLSVIRYPKDMHDEDFEAIIKGIRDACTLVGARNVGGDIGTAERIILSASAIGSVEPGMALRRNGARTGDVLCMTGHTGIAGAAQKYFYEVPEGTHELSPYIEDRLINAWRRPEALIRQGRLLSSSGGVTSCQDSSDGLKAAIESLGSASSIGFTLQREDVPISPLVEAVCNLRNLNPLDIVFGDSVDFQLVFTVAPGELKNLRAQFASAGLDFFQIGIAQEKIEISILDENGTVSALPGKAWRHSS